MMDFTFEESPWEQALEKLRPGDVIDAVTFLTLLEQEEEDAVEEACRGLEEKHITLDISRLPCDLGSGDMALRLRQEKELASRDDLRTGLEETDPLYLYLEELSAIPAAGEESGLAERLAAGEEAAAEMLVNLSLHRCVELAKEMTGRGVLLLDLIQEASLGLWQGVLTYTGGDFAAHRDWWIRQYLAKTVTLQARSSGLGQKLREGMEDYRDVDQRLLTELGRNPTLEEIAEAMHITPEDAAVYGNMVTAARSRRKVEQAREEPEPTLEDDQAVEDTAYFQSRQRVLDMLSGLSEQEAKLLTLRFGLEGGMPMSPEDTGRKLGMTPDEVVRTEAAALKKLRGEELN